MKKVMLIIFVLAAVVSGGLLYYQWNEKEAVAPTDYTVSAKLTYSNYGLQIEQKFKNLQTEKVVLQIPKQVVEIVGTYDDGEEIEYVNSNRLLTFPAKGTGFALNYKYTYNETGTVHLLPAPFFYLNKDSGGRMDLSVYDQTHEYSWIFDGQLLGSTARDAFSLTMYWDGSLENDLYLTKGNIQLVYEQDGVKIFTSDEVKNYRFKTMLGKIKPYGLVADNLTIVVENAINKNLYGQQTVVVPNQKNANAMEFSLTKALLLKEYQFGAKTKTNVADFITYFVLKQVPTDKKLATMYKYMTENLTEFEQESWLKAVLADKHTKLTPQRLDDMLDEVMNKPTQYFYLNFTRSSYIPFFESLDLNLSYHKQELDYTGILYNGRTYYPMDLFRTLKFQVKELDNKHLQLIYKGDKWDLRTDRNVFQFNNEYLEISRSPIARIAGQMYIEEYWLSELFQIRIITVGNQGEIIFKP